MSSFFEPLPPRPASQPRVWGPPAWDRPSEGTLPALMPVNEIVARSDDAVAVIEHLAVYPNGFTINLLIMTNPHGDLRAGGGRMLLLGGGASVDPYDRVPRVGVRFADGRTAGQNVGPHPFTDAEKDENGFPTSPIIRMTGGGGGGHDFRTGLWVYPLPPSGPLEIFVSAPQIGGGERKVVLEGAEVLEAAARAQVIWS